jgi:acyl-coenzyme A synthetase/AMP-(fatty) acid ligase
LKVSGIFVAPAEIENCLLQHEAVMECAVVGSDTGDGLVKPKAFIVLREETGTTSAADRIGSRTGAESVSKDTLADELREFVKERLAPYKYPRWIEFVPSLPKNDRGKIDRRKLKDL